MRRVPDIVLLLRRKGSKKALKLEIVPLRRGGYVMRSFAGRLDVRPRTGRRMGSEVGRMICKLLADIRRLDYPSSSQRGGRRAAKHAQAPEAI